MENTFKVKILNYQRIRKASLEFIPGLNVIVGESNNGKSSLNRSIATCVYNIPRESHITLGETKSAVGIQYNGHEVLWRRDKESASQVSYRIDGKIYQKLGRGQFEKVAEALNMAELEINEKKFRLNFSKQMAYPFLLDSTPSEMFKFIAQSSGEDNLIEVLKQMKKDVNEISNIVKSTEETQKVLGETLSQLESRYKLIKGNRDYCEEIISMDSKVRGYQWLLDKIETYKKCLNARDKMNNSLVYYKNKANELTSSISLVELSVNKLNNISILIDQYSETLLNKSQMEVEKSNYERVISKYLDIDRVYENYKSLELSRVKLDNIKGMLLSYRGQVNELSNNRILVENEQNKLAKYDKFIEAIGKVLAIKDSKQVELENIQQQVSSYASTVLQIKSYKVEKEYIHKELGNISKQIDAIGVCPYCGSVLGGNHE